MSRLNGLVGRAIWVPLLAVIIGAAGFAYVQPGDQDDWSAEARVSLAPVPGGDLVIDVPVAEQLAIARSDDVRERAREDLAGARPDDESVDIPFMVGLGRQGTLSFRAVAPTLEGAIRSADAGAQAFSAVRRQQLLAEIDGETEQLLAGAEAGNSADERRLLALLADRRRIESASDVVAPARITGGGSSRARSAADGAMLGLIFGLAVLMALALRGGRRRREAPARAGRRRRPSPPGAAPPLAQTDGRHAPGLEEYIAPPIEVASRTDGISRQAALIFGARATVVVATAALTIYIARVLGPDSFGVYALALTIGTGLGLIADLGVINSTSRYAAEALNRGESPRPALMAGLRIKVPVSLIAFGLLLGAAGPMEQLFDIDGLAPAIRVAAFVGVFEDLFALVVKVLWSLRRAGSTLAMSVVRVVGESTTAIALIALGYGAAGALAGRGVGFVGALLLVLLLATRMVRVGQRAADGFHSATILRYGFHLWLAELAWVGFQLVDQVLLGILSGAASVAQYEASWRIATVVALVGVSLASAVAPRLADTQDEALARRMVSEALRRLLVLYVPLACVLAIAAPVLLPALLGDDYAPAADVLMVLAPFIALAGAAPLLSESIDYLGIGQVRKWLALAAVTINLVLDLILIPQVGIIGPAIATDAAIAVYAGGLFVICHRRLELTIGPLAASTFRAALAAAGAGAAAWGATVVSGGAVAAAGALALGGLAAIAGLALLGELQTVVGPPGPGPLGRVSRAAEVVQLRGTRTVEVRRARRDLAAGIAVLASAAALGAVAAWSLIAALLCGVAVVAAVAAALVRPSAPAILLMIIPLAIPFSFLRLGPMPSNTIIGIVAVLAVVGAITARPTRVALTLPLIPVIPYLAWVVASGGWSVSLGDTVAQWAGLAVSLTFMAVLVIFVDSRERLTTLLWGVAIAATTSAVTSFIFPGGDGFTDPESVVLTGDRNFFSAFQVVAIPLILALATQYAGRCRLGLYGAAGLAGLSVVTSTSRSGVIALAVIAVGIALVPKGSLHATRRARAVYAACTVVVAAAATVTLAGPVIDRFTQGEDGDSGRLNLFYAAQSTFAAEPLHGVGYGAFPAEAAERQLEDPRVNVVTDILRPNLEVHNAFLGSAAELGWPGLILFSAVMLASGLAGLAALRRSAHNSLDRATSAALLVGLVGWLVMSMTLSIEGGRLTWMLVGIASALWAVSRMPVTTRRPRARRGRRRPAPAGA